MIRQCFRGGATARILTAAALAATTGGAAGQAQAAAGGTRTQVTAVKAAPASSALIARRRVDVDGDGRRDVVRVTRRGATATITVTTAAQKVASARFVNMDSAGPDFRWRYAALLDGARGAEVVIHTGECGTFDCDMIFTWRNGKVTTVNQNRKNSLDPRYWTYGSHAQYTDGYTFTKIGNKPAVRVWSIDHPFNDTSSTRHVYDSTSLWNGRGWTRAVDREYRIAKTRAAWNRIAGPAPRDLSIR